MQMIFLMVINSKDNPDLKVISFFKNQPSDNSMFKTEFNDRIKQK